MRRMCQVLEVSVSGYYAWKQRKPSVRERADEQLIIAIRHAYQKSYGIYGSRRLHAVHMFNPLYRPLLHPHG